MSETGDGAVAPDQEATVPAAIEAAYPRDSDEFTKASRALDNMVARRVLLSEWEAGYERATHSYRGGLIQIRDYCLDNDLKTILDMAATSIQNGNNVLAIHAEIRAELVARWKAEAGERGD